MDQKTFLALLSFLIINIAFSAYGEVTAEEHIENKTAFMKNYSERAGSATTIAEFEKNVDHFIRTENINTNQGNHRARTYCEEEVLDGMKACKTDGMLSVIEQDSLVYQSLNRSSNSVNSNNVSDSSLVISTASATANLNKAGCFDLYNKCQRICDIEKRAIDLMIRKGEVVLAQTTEDPVELQAQASYKNEHLPKLRNMLKNIEDRDKTIVTEGLTLEQLEASVNLERDFVCDDNAIFGAYYQNKAARYDGLATSTAQAAADMRDQRSSIQSSSGSVPTPTAASSNGKSGSNWVNWALGIGAVGGLGLLFKKQRDKDKAKEKKEEQRELANRAVLDAANDSLRQAEACAQTGSENFPACEGYLVDNCNLYYGGKYSPFSLVEEPESNAPETERVTYASQERISTTLQGVCGRFNTAYCGTESDPSSNSSGDFCQAMESRQYCLEAGNEESPTCIQLANQSNPICIDNPESCAQQYPETYLSSTCPNFTDDPLCEDYVADQIASGEYPGTTVVTSSSQNKPTTPTASTQSTTSTSSYYHTNSNLTGFGAGGLTPADIGGTQVVVVSSLTGEGTAVGDIAPERSSGPMDSYTNYMQTACAQGQPYGCQATGSGNVIIQSSQAPGP